MSNLPKNKRFFILCILVGLTWNLWGKNFPSASDIPSGMYIPPYFPEEVANTLDEVGSDLYPENIYQVGEPSLKDLIVYLSNGYSGVLLSENGLLLTNYRPFASFIHSIDSLDQEFVAKDFEEEVPISNLSAYILQNSESIDGWIQSRLKNYHNEADRKHQIDSVCYLIQNEQVLPQGTVAKIQVTVHGHYFLNFYKKYDDLRMVYAPAKAKALWDQPALLPQRHQADFSLLRIYTARDNSATSFTEFNRPIENSAYAVIARDPYKEGDCIFALGYPNQSERLAPSAILQEEFYHDSIKIQVREQVKKLIGNLPSYQQPLNVDSIYASHQHLLSQGILEQKTAREEAFTIWAANQTDFQRVLRYSNVLPFLNRTYLARHHILQQYELTRALFKESKIIQMGYLLLGMNEHNEKEVLQSLSNYFEKLDVNTEMSRLQTLLEVYETQCDSIYRPLSYSVINYQYKGKFDKYLKKIFKKSFVCNEEKFVMYLDCPTRAKFNQDPILQLCADLKSRELSMYKKYNSYNPTIAQLIQLYYEGLAIENPIYKEKTDANYTLRFSWGKIQGYSPYAGFQIPAIEKLQNLSDYSFLHPYSYATNKQEDISSNDSVQTDFLTTLDFPSGRMGEAVFNLNGELIGILYGVNPEAQNNCYYYDSIYHRSIAGDIHYLIYLLERAQAHHLIEEFTFGEIEQTVDIEYVQPDLNLRPIIPDSLFTDSLSIATLSIDSVLTIRKDSLREIKSNQPNKTENE